MIISFVTVAAINELRGQESIYRIVINTFGKDVYSIELHHSSLIRV